MHLKKPKKNPEYSCTVHICPSSCNYVKYILTKSKSTPMQRYNFLTIVVVHKVMRSTFPAGGARVLQGMCNPSQKLGFHKKDSLDLFQVRKGE